MDEWPDAKDDGGVAGAKAGGGRGGDDRVAADQQQQKPGQEPGGPQATHAGLTVHQHRIG